VNDNSVIRAVVDQLGLGNAAAPAAVQRAPALNASREPKRIDIYCSSNTPQKPTTAVSSAAPEAGSFPKNHIWFSAE
jgi:hypothetical protein